MTENLKSSLLLNLSDFTPFEYFKDQFLEVEYSKFIFNGGEPHVRIIPNLSIIDIENSHELIITHRIKKFEDLGFLLLAIDAIKRLYEIEIINLVLPYFPGARQDRVMVDGDPLTVKVYADIINSLNLNSIIIMDPHSDVTPALLNNNIVWNNYDFIKNVISNLNEFHLISPDAGANKKVNNLAKSLGVNSIIKCDKNRNVSTGQITDFEVYATDLNKKDCLIVDDICDGGGTFNGLAEELKKKNAGKLYLAVTHGIFSKGFDIFENFEKIYTTDSFIDLKFEKHPYNHPKLEIIKLKDIIKI